MKSMYLKICYLYFMSYVKCMNSNIVQAGFLEGILLNNHTEFWDFIFSRRFVNLAFFLAHFFLFAKLIRVEAAGVVGDAVWRKMTQDRDGCQTQSRHMVMLDHFRPGIIN